MSYNIEAVTQMGKNFINVALDENEVMDEISLKMLKHDCPAIICHFSTTEINGDTVLQFDTENAMSLEYVTMQLSQEDFIKLYKNMLRPFLECKSYLLKPEGFCLDSKFIFVNKYNFEVKYIYLPIQNVKSTETIKDIFYKTLQNCEPQGDSKLQIDLYRLFAQGEVSAFELNEIVNRYANDAMANNFSTAQPMSPTAPRPQKIPIPQVQSIPAAAPVPKAADSVAFVQPPLAQPAAKNNLSPEELLELEIMSGLGGKSQPGKKGEKPAKPVKEKKGGLFGFGKKEPKAPKNRANEVILGAANGAGAPSCYTPPAPMQQTAPASYINAEDDSTQILGVESSSGSDPVLLFSGTQQPNIPSKIVLRFNNDAVTFGRASSGDTVQKAGFLFHATIKSISRLHARIQRENGSYFIIDLGSANGTYLNGTRLVPNMQYELQSGSKIGFSNKNIDYIFNL